MKSIQAAGDIEDIIIEGGIDNAPEKIKVLEHEFSRLKECVQRENSEV